jgi:Ca2+-binding EF-hand superfamily protein
LKDELNIPYKEFLRLLCVYQIKNRDKYLKNFVDLFRKFDTNNDGILNENEFVDLIKSIPYCQKNIEINIFKFLSIVDPFNNKKIIFSDCVKLFSMEDLKENENENSENTNLLDKICLNNNI